VVPDPDPPRRYLDLVSERWDAALGRLAKLVESEDG
jgi:hypothetical protein